MKAIASSGRYVVHGEKVRDGGGVYVQSMNAVTRLYRTVPYRTVQYSTVS